MKNIFIKILIVSAFITFGFSSTAKASDIATSSYTMQSLRYNNGCGGFETDMKNGWGCGEILSPYIYKLTASTTIEMSSFTFNNYEYDGSGVVWSWQVFNTQVSTTTPVFTLGNVNGYFPAQNETYGIATTTLYAGNSLYFKPVKVSGGTSSFFSGLVSIQGVDTGGTYDPELPIITSLYPPNATSTFIHDFSDFTFGVLGTNSTTTTYKFSVTYDTTSTLDYMPRTIVKGVNYLWSPKAQHFLSIFKPEKLGVASTTTTYYFKVCEINTDTCSAVQQFNIGATNGTFTFDSSKAGFFNSTTTETTLLNIQRNGNGSLPNYYDCEVSFYNPSSWACVVGQKIINVTNSMADSAKEYMQGVADNLTDIFPINIFTTMNANIELARLASETPPPDIDIGSNPKIFMGRAMPILSATSVSAVFASDKLDFDIRSWIDKVLYLITAGIIIMSSIGLIRNLTNTNA